MSTYVLSFDVESLGLHGSAFSVGAVVVDESTGEEMGSVFFTCDHTKLPDYPTTSERDLKWLQENVFPHLPKEPNCDDAREMRDRFWAFYRIWQARTNNKLTVMAEWGVPVEANFLHACIMDNIKERHWEGPSPLDELATLMNVLGMDRNATYERRPDEMPAHVAVTDARQSARLWVQCKSILNRQLPRALVQELLPNELKPVQPLPIVE